MVISNLLNFSVLYMYSIEERKQRVTNTNKKRNRTLTVTVYTFETNHDKTD